MLDGEYRGFEIATHDPGIAVITFNQPDRLNGLGRGMKRDLHEVMLQAQLDPDTRVVVFTGTGRGFCAGDDVFNPTENDRHIPTLVPEQVLNVRHSQVDQYALLRVYSQELVRSIRNLDKLTIAAMNGVAIQLGLSLALACDYRIASTEEALDLGLVTEVVAPDALMPRTMELATELADGPQVAMRMLKRSLYNAVDQTFGQAGDDIAAKTAVSDDHPDTREGMAAYRERRPPHFNRWLEEPVTGGHAAWFTPKDPEFSRTASVRCPGGIGPRSGVDS